MGDIDAIMQAEAVEIITPGSMPSRTIGTKFYRVAHGKVEIWEQVSAGTRIATHYIDPGDIAAVHAALRSRVVGWGPSTRLAPRGDG